MHLKYPKGKLREMAFWTLQSRYSKQLNIKQLLLRHLVARLGFQEC